MGSDSKPAMAPYRQRWAATASQQAEASNTTTKMTLPTSMIMLMTPKMRLTTTMIMLTTTVIMLNTPKMMLTTT